MEGKLKYSFIYFDVLLRKMTDFTDIHITKQEALDNIYDCFSRWLSFSQDEFEEGEIQEEKTFVTYWGNEFIFRDSCSDKEKIFRLVNEDSVVFANGIDEFRDNTHVVFKETSFGVMWKILPLSVVNTFPLEQYDGCFTENYDGIIDRMNMVNQAELFGTFLDITKENRKYIVWTALCA